MRSLKRKLILAGLTAALVVTMTACDNKSDTNKKTLVEESGSTESGNKTAAVSADDSILKQLVVSVGNEDVYYSEAMIYFKYIQAKYEAYFGNAIWDYDFGSRTFGDMAKQEIIDMIVQTKIIDDQANKYKVVLSEDDELQVQQNSEKFLAGLTEEDKARYGLTEEAVQAFYRDNKIYEGVYDAATMDVDTDVSDDAAKQVTIQQILVSTTETDGAGNTKPMSDEMKKKEYQKAKNLWKEAKDTKDFYSLAKANTESKEVQYTFGKGDMPEAFEKVAFSLKTGELSRIVETEEGYHIIYCVSDYDEDATLEKKEEVIEERQDKYFQSLYKEWVKSYKVHVNDKVWNAMEFTMNSDTSATEDSTEGSKGDSTKNPSPTVKNSAD